MDNQGLNTRALLAGADPEQWKDWDLMPPVSHAAVFKQVGPGRLLRFNYSRLGNPTRQALENALATLDNGKHGLVFTSGSAAIVAAVHLLSAGDHIVAMDDLYPGTIVYFTQFINRMNVSTTFVEATKTENVLSAIQANTKLIWLETTSNPRLKIPNIREICETVHAKNPEIVVVVDNTFVTSCIVRPLDLGADIVLHSCSKYINGHHDGIMGSLTMKSDDLHEKLLFIQQTLGAVPSAADCYTTFRSLKTLPLRMERHQLNGLAVAKFLQSDKRVVSVSHPLLPTHPQHQLALSQNNARHSGMVSCVLSGHFQNVENFLQAIKVCLLATSLGGVCTTICVPSSMTADGLEDSNQKMKAISGNFLRISVGLEDIQDIIADLKQALDKAYQ